MLWQFFISTFIHQNHGRPGSEIVVNREEFSRLVFTRLGLHSFCKVAQLITLLFINATMATVALVIPSPRSLSVLKLSVNVCNSVYSSSHLGSLAV